MRRLALVFLLTLAVLAGCAKGAPKAVTPETEFDFGDVPVTSEVRVKEFVISNDGTADLKLGQAKVETLEGC